MTLFPRIKTPYYIWTPSYTHKSSGVRTLHLLCHALNEIGEKAYLVPMVGAGEFAMHPHLNTPALNHPYESFYGDNFIGVYPDIVRGNPMNAKRVVRYLLAPRGAYGGDAEFPATDNIWGALPSIADKVLRIPVSDTSIFYNDGQERSGSCFYSHKYEMHGNQLLDITKDSTRLEGSLENLADILRKSTVCYIYEVSSILTEAALCGCPVVLVRSRYFNKIDPECMMGNVKWSDGEIVKECDNYLPEYHHSMLSFWGNLQLFIKDTQDHK